MSKLFKSSRVVLDDESFVLSAKVAALALAGDDSSEKDGEKEIITPATLETLLAEAKVEAEGILTEADEEAERIVQNAHKSAEKIIADGYDQAKGIMEKAQQDGYQVGYEKAIEDSRASSEQIIQEALGIREAWHDERARLMKDVEGEMVALILETLEKMVNKKIDEDEMVIEGLIKAAIKKMNRMSYLVLRVSSEDYENAVHLKPMILSMTEKIDDIEIKQDVKLVKGSCIIDSEAGSIDNSLWTQYEQIKQVFEDLLKSE